MKEKSSLAQVTTKFSKSVAPYCKEGAKFVQKTKIGHGNSGEKPLVAKITGSNFPFCEEVEKYVRETKIGQGTFGEVFKARHRENGNVVALKRILTENEEEGFPMTALREIRILQVLKHENVVNLIEVCRSKEKIATFFMVFDFCEHDLSGLLSNKEVKFAVGEIKMIMKQLLNGLYFIHSSKILHRDIKPANILITKTGTLKIADFGLARSVSDLKRPDKPNKFTNPVVTLWYRPPELLLGERNYGPPVDLWSAGCIMAELWTRYPILQGMTEPHQIKLISMFCGSITPESFQGCEKLNMWTKLDLSKDQKEKIEFSFGAYVKDEHAIDLLKKLLTLDPAKRIDSDSALDHNFFWRDPLPCELATMLGRHKRCMFDYVYRQEKANAKQPGAGPSRAHPTANDDQYHDMVF